MRTDRGNVAGRLGHSHHTATVLVAVLAGACSDAVAPHRESDPGGFVASVSASATAPLPVAYVSLPPGQIPGGTQATLRTLRASRAITVPVIEGGFDPVPVPAAEGDTITISVATATATVSTYTVIPRRSRPTIVRTSPPRGKRDVAVNSQIAIVFSEPINPATLTTTSIQLRNAGIAVPGQIQMLGSIGTVIEFIPAVLLEDSTDYELVLSDAIRDLEGAQLVATSVPFTTGSTLLGPVAMVTVSPNYFELRVGQALMVGATMTDAAGDTLSGRAMTWTSSDSTVATVAAVQVNGSPSAHATVTAVAAGGPVTITATSEGRSASARVAITPSGSGGSCPGYAIPTDCPPFATGGPDSIVGVVRERSATGLVPLAGALVSALVQTALFGYSHCCTQTDSAGAYRIGYLPTDATVVLYAWQNSYDMPCAAVTTPTSATIDLELVREANPLYDPDPPQPALVGVVYEQTASGRLPIAGARVFFETPFDIVTATTTTDAQGRYSLCHLPTTTSWITPVKSGYRIQGQSVAVSGLVTLDLELIRE